ncbi:MAG: 23S rRNA (uridine(2552)-2'-O)-methyltransferase RlmE [Pseudomonadales bacterium]|nr:23S rRNA (uridine(2552)-2'-O)-methyltransferase RlmE [Pseudomonadales bacterium]
MSKSKSSSGWMQRHISDQYVQQAQRDGYRSRASYKLLEIQARDRIIKPGMSVIDLGCAPGGWCQVLTNIVGEKGRIVGVDLLPMDPVEDIEFIEGDFTEDDVLEQILALFENSRVGLVVSDMAPNISGIKSADTTKSIYLAELGLDLCNQILAPKGSFLVKIFQGEGFDQFLKEMRQVFTKVSTRKPKASRPKSREMYLLGTGYKGAK